MSKLARANWGKMRLETWASSERTVTSTAGLQSNTAISGANNAESLEP